MCQRGFCLNELAQGYFDIVSATFELTYSCNFKCIHCYNQDSKSQEVFDIRNLHKLIAFLNKYEVKRVYLFGGEPLIHPEFAEIYKVLYSEGFQLSLTTNGSLINSNILDLFVKHPPVILWVSIYGFNQIDYMKSTKSDSYAKVFDNIRLLEKHKINLYFKIISLNSIGNFMDIVDYANNHSQSQVSSSFIPTLTQSTTPLNFEFPVAIKDAIHKSLKSTSSGLIHPSDCQIYQNSVVIDPTGHLRPCIPFPKKTSESIFKSNDYLKVLNQCKTNHNSLYFYDHECALCKHNSICGCPIIIYLYGNSKNLRCKKVFNLTDKDLSEIQVDERFSCS